MSKQYVDINTLKYLLYDVHQLEKILENDKFKEHDLESLNMFLDSIRDFSDKELYPFFKEMDETPAYHKDGTVYVHEQVKKVMQQSGDLGIISACFNYNDGGLQMPFSVLQAAVYIMDAANNHLPGYPSLTQGAAELIVEFGNDDLKETYVPNMLAGKWGGTMCLTEPQAGSSLSDVVTKAAPTENSFYKISGQKIFISGGDYHNADNIIHNSMV